ncbi:hypothetical protein Pyn_34981 [Prunus yedoensis var. nudiflora]|uniref:Uncharacterized protein n=1 Tax=Prunus yedoensis var. nudiflora TaxID=2094558 RepID=A0A314UFF4_PRUYE|nr:hypothetical protein Pyn_34981 [Prunus yedoensis var. nudiflora]
MELRYAGKFMNNGKDYEGDHEVDVPDIIEENYSQSQQTDYEQFCNDIPDECFSQVNENFVKTQCKNYVNDGGKVAKGKGTIVPIYEDSGDEFDKEIYDEENDAALEDDNMFMHNVQIPKVPVYVEKKKKKQENPFIPQGHMNDTLLDERYGESSI